MFLPLGGNLDHDIPVSCLVCFCDCHSFTVRSGEQATRKHVWTTIHLSVTSDLSSSAMAVYRPLFHKCLQ